MSSEMKMLSHCAPLLAILLVLPSAESAAQSAASPSVAEARKFLEASAEKQRKRRENQSFEEFKAGTYKEPFAGGKFIVNGDTPIASEKLLREFYEKSVKNKSTNCDGEACEFII